MDAENVTVEENSIDMDLKVENVNEMEHNLSTNENLQQIEVEANSQTAKMKEDATQVENVEEVQKIEEKVLPEIIKKAEIKESNINDSTEANHKMEEESIQVENVEEVQKNEEKVVPEIIEKEEIKESNINDSTVSNHKMEEESIQVENVEEVQTSEEKEETQSSKAQGMGLNMIAQYDSDADDTETEAGSETVPYRQQAVHVHSDTDSDSSTDESTCSESHFSLKKEKQDLEKMLSYGSDDDDEDNKSPKQRRQPKVKGELLLEDLPPIEDLYITVPEDECVELGKVQSIVDQLVLVSVLPNSLLVDLDTVLFLNKGRKVLGAVFDVLGQISEPLYCVRFNSNEQIKEKNINIGDVVYVAPKTEYTQFIILSNLMKVRGSDASWENDVEPPPRFIDYSDDEEERQARARSRNKDRRTEAEHTVQQKRAMNEDTDNESNASFDTRPAYRRHNAHGAGTSRGRGRGMPHMHNRGYAMPHAGSWHSNYYQGPPPQQMFYPPYPMHMMPPNMAYPPNFAYNTPPPPPPPPGSSQYDNNNM